MPETIADQVPENDNEKDWFLFEQALENDVETSKLRLDAFRKIKESFFSQ
jgi:competence protein ComGF